MMRRRDHTTIGHHPQVEIASARSLNGSPAPSGSAIASTAVVQKFRIAAMTTLEDRTHTPGGSHSDHMRMKLILNRRRIALCLTALVTASGILPATLGSRP